MAATRRGGLRNSPANAQTLTVLAAILVVYTRTAYVDINYTSTRRVIGPFEQLVHALMIGVPIFAWVLLLLLIGRADAGALAEWSFKLRAEPWELWIIITILAGGAIFSAAPTFAELWQTWRFARRGCRPQRRAALRAATVRHDAGGRPIRGWLSPAGRSVAALQEILSDRQAPCYEHEVLAA